ncbi:hypothetical protein SODALDRAFT_155552 [Sodiomyces alkalinus F11]|uniref:Transmembrane protein n=1 Tax=Sodiomyces alkalinus (strain CBS 110278 / VKM F-3762 / F11) TaxID=1314773 RepID=A0A3N2PXJ3_SODAK|nr:hypothetical protein SODALDRAFT_155552 [Sodiomyces alkalinus F11]ROT39249.1 hypothetical protein SODALDRAFT_155552 [Sodiomyces alkalinus F11]
MALWASNLFKSHVQARIGLAGMTWPSGDWPPKDPKRRMQAKTTLPVFLVFLLLTHAILCFVTDARNTALTVQPKGSQADGATRKKLRMTDNGASGSAQRFHSTGLGLG